MEISLLYNRKIGQKGTSSSQNEDCITLQLVLIISKNKNKKIEESKNTILDTVEQIKIATQKGTTQASLSSQNPKS